MPYKLETSLVGANNPRNYSALKSNGEVMSRDEMIDGLSQLIKPNYVDGFMIGNSLRAGQAINPEHVIRHWQVKATQKSLPQIFDLGVGLCISDSVKNKIENLEPNVHQFIQVELKLRDGANPLEKYYFFNNCLIIRTIDLAKSGIKIDNRQSVKKLIFEKESEIFIDKNLSKNHPLWIESGMYQLVFFVSDEFFDFLSQYNVKKIFKCTYCKYTQ